ncbi:MAG TPA: GGDEF domain-containing protein [Candidatus Dormibacteraeota bacterium]|nr:GGDEF domain-containing protein [Candidatus Dormibacteraeota bacterium]
MEADASRSQRQEQLLGPPVVGSRRLACLASILMLGAAMTRLLTLSLPPQRLGAEIGLGVLGLAYAAVAVGLFNHDLSRRGLLVLTQAVIPALIAGAMLAVAAGYLDNSGVIAVLFFSAINLGGPPLARAAARLAATGLVEGVFAAVWLNWLHGDVPTLLVAIAFMLALQLVVSMHAHAAGVAAGAQSVRSSAYAATAERVGTAIDVLGVTRAVLETTMQSFPMATHAAVLLYEPAVGRLRPLPLYLSPKGVRALETDNLDVTLAPGEGLAGKVFASSRPMLWQTAYDVALAQADIGEGARRQNQDQRRGVTRCAVGAPLIIDEEVIGAYVITSTRQELVWDDQDLSVVAALAGEAARAIERARRYERELDQAHLDSITGLANHRQLTRTLEQEVARARRLNTSLGVVFCDLDLFKMVNDTYGHAEGDRVLTILAQVFHDSLRREDSAARYGGDEFVCVLPGADREESDAIGRRISLSFETRIRDDRELAGAGLTISCGVAIFPDDAADAGALLQHADAAMRLVKLNHRGSIPASAPPG